jgi:hypothetical protein
MPDGLNATKFLWQVSHCIVVGIWDVGFDKPEPPGKWQVEHRFAVGTAAWLKVATAHDAVLL